VKKMSAARLREKHGAKGTRARIEAVAATLEAYARRGVFRGFSPAGDVRQERAVFRLLWHRDRVFEFVFDARRNTIFNSVGSISSLFCGKLIDVYVAGLQLPVLSDIPRKNADAKCLTDETLSCIYYAEAESDLSRAIRFNPGRISGKPFDS
jgi:hypothetical protein